MCLLSEMPFSVGDREPYQMQGSLGPRESVSEMPSQLHTHTHPFNGPFSGTTGMGRYQKGKTNLDFTEARDSEWQWHQQGHMQVCTSLQTDNHASTPPSQLLQLFLQNLPACSARDVHHLVPTAKKTKCLIC